MDCVDEQRDDDESMRSVDFVGDHEGEIGAARMKRTGEESNGERDEAVEKGARLYIKTTPLPFVRNHQTKNPFVTSNMRLPPTTPAPSVHRPSYETVRLTPGRHM